MKIAIVSSTFLPTVNGVSMHIQSLVKGLEAEGHLLAGLDLDRFQRVLIDRNRDAVRHPLDDQSAGNLDGSLLADIRSGIGNGRRRREPR